jgi:primosomal protein N''
MDKKEVLKYLNELKDEIDRLVYVSVGNPMGAYSKQTKFNAILHSEQAVKLSNCFEEVIDFIEEED